MSDEYPHFHKLQISEGKDIPINAVVRNNDGEKQTFKFRYADGESVGVPGTVESLALDIGDPDEEELELIEVAAEGVERHSEYEVSFDDQ